ncbi:hypothetical protein H0N98_00645 [Candidatus Micrarchaeota archaeon]|nr:hypothetical protein [Candidatus Micrarchaeota archaeon]
MLLLIDLSGGKFLGGWESVALLALLVSFGIIGIAFAIGIGFHYRELEEWAKAEFYEVIMTGFLLGVLVAFVNFLFGISTNLAGGNPLDIAHNCLYQMLYDTSGVFLQVFLYNMYISALSTLMLGFFIPITIPEVITIRIGSYINPWAGFSGLALGIDTIFNLISAMIALILAQQVLLDFFKVTMFKYFLPLGVLMRTFPLTRVAGSTIIAVAVSAYLIYPLAIIYTTSLYNSFKAVIVPGQPGNFYSNLLLGPIVGDITAPMGTINDMMRNFVIITACFGLTVVITLSSVRSLATALGGDPDLFGLARLI